MKNGLYKVSFKTPLGQGNGVVVINNGSIKGGDSMMYYTGTFQLDGNQFTANIHVGKHSDAPGMSSVFGLNDVDVQLQGTATDTSATIQGSAAGVPLVTLQAQLTLIIE